MSKIAIVGKKDVYAGFKALGVTVRHAQTPQAAEQAVLELASQGFSIIFISEGLARELGTLFERFRKSPTPVIVMIPDNMGSLGVARERIRKLVERAVGIDILSRGETIASMEDEPMAIGRIVKVAGPLVVADRADRRQDVRSGACR
jgi:V/A-type H+-transporting ATPase subunit F